VIIGNKINTLYSVDMVASNPSGSVVYGLVNYSREENGQIRRLSSLTVQGHGHNKPFVLPAGNYIFFVLCRK
jgi:hypothetical protein